VGGSHNSHHKEKHTNFDSRKGVGLEVNPETTKCMLLSRQQNAGQNQNIKTVNRFFENKRKKPKFDFGGN
jgi:hypothetical protein